MPSKQCTCGKIYTAAEWRELRFHGTLKDVEREPASPGREDAPLRSVELRTCPACGSTISRTIPPSGKASEPKVSLVASRPPTRANPAALVVEDDPAVGRAMARTLRKIGFETTLSGNGADALERIRRGERFALVVSDVRMPVMGGPAFRRAALALWPALDEVLVFVTGDREEALRERLDSANRCFAKPLDTEFYAHVRGVREALR